MESALNQLIIHCPRTLRAAYDAGGYREREIMCNAHTVRIWDGSAVYRDGDIWARCQDHAAAVRLALFYKGDRNSKGGTLRGGVQV